LTAAKNNKRNSVKLLLPESILAMATRNEFLIDMCYALVVTNIPFNKLHSTPFINFLRKYVNQNIPDESTLRKNYLKICFESTLTKIREKLTNNFIYIMVNEITDSRGLYICSLTVGILHPEIMPTLFLISCKELEKTNYETVSRFVNDSLTEFFRDTYVSRQNSAIYQRCRTIYDKNWRALKIFYSNMIHITCVAYGLNDFKMFLKASHRITTYKNFIDFRLHLEPVIMRWGTWLDTALFYSENFSKFKDLVSNQEDNAQSVKKIKTILSTTSIISDLAFTRSHLSHLLNYITQLEEQNLTLNY